jgi:hypothetical protein
MAYLDGEVAADRSKAIQAHLAQCAACQSAAAGLRAVSKSLASWQMEAPPLRLKAPDGTRPGSLAAPESAGVAWWRQATSWRYAGAAAMLAVVVTGIYFSGGASLSRSRPPRIEGFSSPAGGPLDKSAGALTVAEGQSASAGRTVAAELPVRQSPGIVGGRAQAIAEAAPPAQASGASKIIRTASLSLIAKDFDAVRPAIERLLNELGGFVGQMQASGGTADRMLQATLRVPAARLDAAMRSLRTLGHVVQEGQSGDDVTEQVQDLETRIANGRNTEKRLNDILKNRTGDVSDVLQVEREIARVREEIERLDGLRVSFERRVTYATITLQVTQQRQATLDLGPQPLSARLRNAIVDGFQQAYESGVEVVLWLLRAGPVVLLWTLVLWVPVRYGVRFARRLSHARSADL